MASQLLPLPSNMKELPLITAVMAVNKINHMKRTNRNSTVLPSIKKGSSVSTWYCNSSSTEEINSLQISPYSLTINYRHSIRRVKLKVRVLKEKVSLNRGIFHCTKSWGPKILSLLRKSIICLRSLINLKCFFSIISKIRLNCITLIKQRNTSGFKKNLVWLHLKRDNVWKIKLMTSLR